MPKVVIHRPAWRESGPDRSIGAPIPGASGQRLCCFGHPLTKSTRPRPHCVHGAHDPRRRFFCDYHDGDTFGFVGSDADPAALASPLLELTSAVGGASDKASSDKASSDKASSDEASSDKASSRTVTRFEDPYETASDRGTSQPSLRAIGGWLVLIALVGVGSALTIKIESDSAGEIAYQSTPARAGVNPAPTSRGATPGQPNRSILKGPVTLPGPNGSVTLPLGEPAIVHVWLQGCSDCMNSFEAYRDLRQEGELEFGVPVVNVSAFNPASQQWAADYGVDERLVHDRGAALVQPLGIGTFTTLVMDAEGKIVHRDYPRNAGYVQRVRDAVEGLQAEAN